MLTDLERMFFLLLFMGFKGQWLPVLEVTFRCETFMVPFRWSLEKVLELLDCVAVLLSGEPTSLTEHTEPRWIVPVLD
jgi:hypothetical protein